MLIVVFTSIAQSFRCKAYEFTHGYKNKYGKIIWNDWETSNVPISVNWQDRRIRIYSQTIQDYHILEISDKHNEINKEGFYYIMECIDKDGLECLVNFRFQYNPKIMQIYIEYKDYSWVYNAIIYQHE